MMPDLRNPFDALHCVVRGLRRKEIIFVRALYARLNAVLFCGGVSSWIAIYR